MTDSLKVMRMRRAIAHSLSARDSIQSVRSWRRSIRGVNVGSV